MIVPQKVKHTVIIWPCNPTLRCTPKRTENTCPHKDLCGNGNFQRQMGITWWPSAQDSALSLLRVKVQSLVSEVRSHKLRGQKNNKRRERKWKLYIRKQWEKKESKILLSGFNISFQDPWGSLPEVSSTGAFVLSYLNNDCGRANFWKQLIKTISLFESKAIQLSTTLSSNI